MSALSSIGAVLVSIAGLFLFMTIMAINRGLQIKRTEGFDQEQERVLSWTYRRAFISVIAVIAGLSLMFYAWSNGPQPS